MFIATLFLGAKRQKQPKYPFTDEWINKTSSIYPKEYYSAVRNKEILPL